MNALSMKIAASLFAIGMAGAAQAADVSTPNEVRGGVKVGVLECDVAGGLGYVIGSAKELNCLFTSSHGGRAEHYTGNIKKLGVDVGFTEQGKLAWAVFAPVAGYHQGALSGLYLGATAEATVVGGLGANVLVGGTGGSLALQPISATAQVGLNVAAGGAALTLVPAN